MEESDWHCLVIVWVSWYLRPSDGQSTAALQGHLKTLLCGVFVFNIDKNKCNRVMTSNSIFGHAVILNFDLTMLKVQKYYYPYPYKQFWTKVHS